MNEGTDLDLMTVQFLFSALTDAGTPPMEAVCCVLALWLDEAERAEMTRLLLRLLVEDGGPDLSPDDMYVLAQTARANVREDA